MLSISNLGTAAQAVDYYEHLEGEVIRGREDYYASGGRGEWWGHGADALGLGGSSTTKATFKAVMEGYDPRSGDALVQRPGEQHRAGWDLTFSAPKSVSAVWAVADEKLRSAIEAAHREAVKTALDYLERNHAYSRRGHGSNDRAADAQRREPASLTVAMYQHGTSRNQDPQLHTHCVVANVAQRSDGSYGALDPQPLYAARMAAGTAYQAELAVQLRGLGLEVRAAEKGTVAIVGVPDQLVEHWSTRRAEIEAKLAADGRRGTAAEAEKATLATRRAKEVLDADLLRDRWRGEAAKVAPEFSAKALHTGKTGELSRMPEQPEALAKLTEQSSVFRAKDVDRLAFENAQRAGLNVAQAEAWARDLIRSVTVVELRDRATGETVYTTREMLAIERGIVERGVQMANNGGHGVDAATVEKILARGTPSAEQIEMVRHITRGGDLAAAQGDAGTGKTYALAMAREAWESAGYRVVGAALSGKAAVELRNGSGIPSSTIASLLLATQSWTDPAGREYPPRDPLSADTVLVIDEAGMIGSRQLSELMERAEAAGAKVVLVGDTKQLPAIEAGCPFRDLQKSLNVSTLTDIRRQKIEEDKQAVRDMAAGNAAAALGNLASRDRLHVYDRAPDARAAVGEAVAKDTAAAGKNSLGVAATRADARAINEAAHQKMREMGQLRGEDVSIKTTVGYRDFAAGDRVVLLKNVAKNDMFNGDFGTITSIQQRGEYHAITIALDRGNNVVVDTEKYTSIDHGYAVTCHKSQAATVDNVHVYASGSGMETKEWGYVSLSRAREEIHVHVDAVTRDEMAADWSRESAKTSTADYEVAGQEQHRDAYADPAAGERGVERGEATPTAQAATETDQSREQAADRQPETPSPNGEETPQKESEQSQTAEHAEATPGGPQTAPDHESQTGPQRDAQPEQTALAEHDDRQTAPDHAAQAADQKPQPDDERGTEQPEPSAQPSRDADREPAQPEAQREPSGPAWLGEERAGNGVDDWLQPPAPEPQPTPDRGDHSAGRDGGRGGDKPQPAPTPSREVAPEYER